MLGGGGSIGQRNYLMNNEAGMRMESRRKGKMKQITFDLFLKYLLDVRHLIQSAFSTS
jgi:hypothetical protein